MKTCLQRLHDRLVHRRILAPLAPRLDDGLVDRTPVRVLARVLGGKIRQPFDQCFAPYLVLLAQLGLPGEVLATGLVGALCCLLELLQFIRWILPRTPVESPPFVAQPTDLLREVLGRQIDADQRLHLLHQLGPLRHDPEGLPVLQFGKLRVDLFQLPCKPRRQGRDCRQLLLNRGAQPGGACRPAVIERRPSLSQQPQDLVCPGFVCGSLRLFGLTQGLAFGIPSLRLLGCRKCFCLRFEFPLTLRLGSGNRGGPLSLDFRLQRLAVLYDDFVRTLQVLDHFALKVRLRLGRERGPAGLEPCEGRRVRRVVRAFDVSGDGGSRLVQIRLQLLRAAKFGELFIAPGRENPMDVLVFPVARGGDQFPQLVRIRDASCRPLADSRRASFEHPLADRRHVSGGDGLRQARFFFVGAHGRVG